jgi:hypothetical protein
MSRTFRLSLTATKLLGDLCCEDAVITFRWQEGTFELHVNGAAPIRVPGRTVEALAAARLISKHPNSNGTRAALRHHRARIDSVANV